MSETEDAGGEERNAHAPDVQETLAATFELLQRKEEEAALAAKMGQMLLENNRILISAKEETSQKLIIVTQEADSLRNELNQLKKIRSQLEAQNTNLIEENDRIITNSQTLTAEIERLKGEIKQLEAIQNKNRVLIQQLDKNYADSSDREKTREEIMKKMRRMEEENKTLLEQNSAMEAEMSILREDIDQIQSRAKKNIASSQGLYEMKIQELLNDNKRLRQEMRTMEDVEIDNSRLREENIRLRSEKSNDLRLYKQTQDELSQLKTDIENDLITPPQTPNMMMSPSLFDELEEQVVKRVKADLLGSRNVLVSSDGSFGAKNVPAKILDVSRETKRDDNVAWVNFNSYLPQLSTATSTKDLVAELDETRLRELHDVLSRVVNAYSSRLVELLQEKDDLNREAEIRSALVLQLYHKSAGKSKPPSRSMTPVNSPKLSTTNTHWFSEKVIAQISGVVQGRSGYGSMSILSKEKIFEAISAGDITITPYDPSAVGCASIDLTLGNEFRYYKPGLNIVRVTEDVDFKDITEKKELKEGETYLLLPGQACLGITKERVTLSGKYCGLLEGRSRFARIGLFVHITAGFMNPGIDNRQVLEIYNASNHPLELVPGTKMCQFIFMHMDGEAKYKGSQTQGCSHLRDLRMMTSSMFNEIGAIYVCIAARHFAHKTFEFRVAGFREKSSKSQRKLPDFVKSLGGFARTGKRFGNAGGRDNQEKWGRIDDCSAEHRNEQRQKRLKTELFRIGSRASTKNESYRRNPSHVPHDTNRSCHHAFRDDGNRTVKDTIYS
ncbi:hypothetical protein PROFUN_00356 [Planoprotostelium fungivorum]|uniref:Uncharacterized protein n=1 Tax=Planoprotostelium fungivorum TaxID=1890364 RepID=A0A2P6NY87_9EUKA|nr:hypothetical protein PROFUN_00356 [Planoprotostelium fungivorum]